MSANPAMLIPKKIAADKLNVEMSCGIKPILIKDFMSCSF
jgi:hypothetical protein